MSITWQKQRTSMGLQLTTLLQNNSILSSGGICEPSELLSFWLDCELLLPIVLTFDSAPSILSSTCSHTLRHCRNSLATSRSCGTDGNLVFFINCNKWFHSHSNKKIHKPTNYLFHAILSSHLRVWQQVEWNFDEFRYGLFDYDFGNPRWHCFMQ